MSVRTMLKSSVAANRSKLFLPAIGVALCAVSILLCLPSVADARIWGGGFGWYDVTPLPYSDWGDGAVLDGVVGISSVGMLIADDGSHVSIRSCWLGYNTGSTGTVTITGSGSTWTSYGNLYVGCSGSGTLNVEAGGRVDNNADSWLGYNTGSTGTATVTGSNSKWTLGDNNSFKRQLFVGFSGSGTLNVEAGGQVSVFDGFLGHEVGSTGTATVTGTGSTWTNYGTLYVGYGGSGELNVEAGGLVSNTAGYLGYLSGSTGTATVTGAGSTWANSAQLIIGNGGSGTLNVEAGGQVSSNSSYLGYESGSTGTATVTGDGSLWWTQGGLHVGTGSGMVSGTLNVEAGGLVSSGGGEVGQGVGSTGRVTVTGTDSTWNTGFLMVGGEGGSGTLNVEDGGLVSTLSTAAYLGLGSMSTGVVTVTGSDSKWTIGDENLINCELFVGSDGSGTLNVEDGGLVRTTSNVWLGYSAMSTGVVTITGAGSKWTTSGDMSYGPLVGFEGSGTLNVEAGGLVSSAYCLLGTMTGSTGTATVTGTGSTWNIEDQLFVGFSGNGTLNVKSGGLVSSMNGYVGYDPNFGAGSTGVGVATVTGIDSKWTNSGELIVGGTGSGTLRVEAGGQVSSVFGRLGYESDSVGAATVTGFGSTWTNELDLIIGDIGSGTLIVEAGGLVCSSGGQVGQGSGSEGTATISGTGSTWTNSRALYVGSDGNGTLNVEDGGLVSDSDGFLGNTSNSTGAATVTGIGSTWTNSDRLIVGDSGDGTLIVEAGGLVSDTDGFLGRTSGSIGAATVTGVGSAWANSDRIVVGDSGNGTLNVEAGGQVSSVFGRLGYESDSVGAATVTGFGSTWTNELDLIIGDIGSGTLIVEAGGLVSSSGGQVGQGSGSEGTATISGIGSTWTNSRALYVGSDGNGTLNVEDGGLVSNTDGILGNTSNSTGAAMVTGIGSTWTNRASLYVGGHATEAGGTGALDVADGGLVFVAGTTKLWSGGTLSLDGGSLTTGSFDNSQLGTFNFNDGTLTINGTGGTFNPGMSSFTLDGNTASAQPTLVVTNASSTSGSILSGILTVGNNHNGNLTVSAGGQISDSYGWLGRNSGSTGTATVTGTGSAWTNGGELVVGRFGSGTLNVEDGGHVKSADGFIARNSGSTGDATVTGSDSRWDIDNALFVGGADSGTASLLVANEAIVEAGDLIHAQNHASVDLLDGTLIAPIVKFSSGSTLSGIGTVEGLLLNDGGTIDIGNSPGTITVLGDYMQSANGRLIVELGGLVPGSEYDFLDVLGLATLDGMLEVHLINTFQPRQDDMFSILGSGTLTGRFSDVSVFGGTAKVDYDYLGGTVRLFDVKAVPEPSTLVLATLGLAVGLAIAWRRRRSAVRSPS